MKYPLGAKVKVVKIREDDADIDVVDRFRKFIGKEGIITFVDEILHEYELDIDSEKHITFFEDELDLISLPEKPKIKIFVSRNCEVIYVDLNGIDVEYEIVIEEKRSFNVGDKVKVVRILRELLEDDEEYQYCVDEYLHMVGEITRIDENTEIPYMIDNRAAFNKREIEHVD